MRAQRRQHLPDLSVLPAERLRQSWIQPMTPRRPLTETRSPERLTKSDEFP